jgi:general stress protein CsbA
MAKLTGWIVTIIGVLMLLPLIGISALEAYNSWLITIGVLVIGIAKLIRNYSGKKK